MRWFLVVSVAAAFAAGCSSEKPVPRVEITTPQTARSGDIVISYILYDPDERNATLEVQYSLDNGVTWLPQSGLPTEGVGGDGTTDLRSAARGLAHSFVWDSVADIGCINCETVRIRMRPTTRRRGDWASSGQFTVQNHPLGHWTTNVAAAEGTEPDVAVDSSTDVIYVVYVSGGDIWIAASEDGGATWVGATEAHAPTATDTESQPAICVQSDGTIRVAYVRLPQSGSTEVRCASLTYDAASDSFTRTADVRVDDDTQSGHTDAAPDVTADSSDNVLVVWSENDGSGNHTVYADVDDGSGFTTADYTVSDATSAVEPEPNVVILPGSPEQAWVFWEHGTGTESQIRQDSATETGSANAYDDWGTDARVDQHTSGENSSDPAAATGSSRIFCFYTDDRASATTGLDLIMAWGAGSPFTEATATAAEGDQTAPAAAAADDDNVWLVYINGNGVEAIKGTYSTAWSFASAERVDDDGLGNAKRRPAVCLYQGAPAVVFEDDRDGTTKVFFTSRSP